MPSSDFGPDGTQAPPPPRLFPDPLAGLVTAADRVAPQWASPSSRVVVPTPPAPAEAVRQALHAQMRQEQRRPRAQRPQPQQQRQSVPRQYLQEAQTPAPQQQQPTQQASGVATFIGCLVVIGFFVLVLLGVLGAIFS
ncbi:hypothetical protein [Lentzea sp. CC55]|uniref:hypothetical protein n=1 Tax=Lentzea sp. CC55 TaxID=2884909 RepID=UPI001F2867F2|nr:hypothetical protein [Lentzea sp. CC55]MCG8924571.1 hypothetical protein [Lentzea sp. CC55]